MSRVQDTTAATRSNFARQGGNSTELILCGLSRHSAVMVRLLGVQARAAHHWGVLSPAEEKVMSRLRRSTLTFKSLSVRSAPQWKSRQPSWQG
jgi:hypothetical protein